DLRDLTGLQHKQLAAEILRTLGTEMDKSRVDNITQGLQGLLDANHSGNWHFSYPAPGMLFWLKADASAVDIVASDDKLERFPQLYQPAERASLLNSMQLDKQRYPQWQQWLKAFPKPHPRRAWNVLLPRAKDRHYRLRTRRRGDRITLPNGAARKLGDIFTDYRIPEFLRDHWAVLVNDQDVPVWLPGLADSETMHEIHAQ